MGRPSSDDNLLWMSESLSPCSIQAATFCFFSSSKCMRRLCPRSGAEAILFWARVQEQISHSRFQDLRFQHFIDADRSPSLNHQSHIYETQDTGHPFQPA